MLPADELLSPALARLFVPPAGAQKKNEGWSRRQTLGGGGMDGWAGKRSLKKGRRNSPPTGQCGDYSTSFFYRLSWGKLNSTTLFVIVSVV